MPCSFMLPEGLVLPGLSRSWWFSKAEEAGGLVGLLQPRAFSQLRPVGPLTGTHGPRHFLVCMSSWVYFSVSEL